MISCNIYQPPFLRFLLRVMIIVCRSDSGARGYPVTPNVVIQNPSEEELMEQEVLRRREQRGREAALNDDPTKVRNPTHVSRAVVVKR